MLRKINLSEFKQSELEVNQLLAAKGGSGDSTTTGGSCHCTGTDSDSKGGDSDS